MTTILLARHGETDWNREGRWQGHADVPLNARGRRQARALARELAGADLAAVYASDLRRATETAAIVAEALRLEVVPEPGLREVDVGEWSGLTMAEVEERYTEAVRRWRGGDAPGWERGETYEQMGARVERALLAIGAAHPRRSVLAVTHGGAIRAARARAAGLDYATFRRLHPLHVGNCELAVLAAGNGALRGVD